MWPIWVKSAFSTNSTGSSSTAELRCIPQGYFDYERDGFGPVVDNENDLLAELEKLAARDFKPDDVYKKRMEETFAFRDGKCCERVYEAIMQLDEPRS